MVDINTLSQVDSVLTP
ncbi:Protein of unknown function [Bacillus mycoides]|uniref:Uncharacterized protein n=1 Tax=Bacillus mycoides TaxID=1405 RepID=A0A1G4EJY1_BACMY|nr:Protein of unknown function [Bacillus mycoides]